MIKMAEYHRKILLLCVLISFLICFKYKLTVNDQWIKYINNISFIETDVRKELPLLTIFTTFKKHDQKLADYNSLRNWRRLGTKEELTTVLFTNNDNTSIVKAARNLGWQILETPIINENIPPSIKDMYMTAQNKFKSTFYGYSNADILYDSDLMKTLKTVKALKSLDKFFITGIRTNVQLKNRTIWELKDIKPLAKEGKLSRPDSADYFFIKHNNFSWEKAMDVVIGRAQVDNYLMAYALLQANMITIEATKTITAVHQTCLDGALLSSNTKLNGFAHNIHMLRKAHFNVGTGRTYNMQYESIFNNTHNSIYIKQKKTGVVLT